MSAEPEPSRPSRSRSRCSLADASRSNATTNPHGECHVSEPYKLIGRNYTTPDLVAKVTGKAKYAEDYRAEGMLFARLLLSPLPHARVKRIDTSAALAMPGVKAILTADDLPAPASSVADNGSVVQANPFNERAL